MYCIYIYFHVPSPDMYLLPSLGYPDIELIGVVCAFKKLLRSFENIILPFSSDTTADLLLIPFSLLSSIVLSDTYEDISCTGYIVCPFDITTPCYKHFSLLTSMDPTAKLLFMS